MQLIKDGITLTENISLKEKVEQSVQTNTFFYSILTQTHVHPTSEMKWTENMEIENEQLDWNKIYGNIYKSTIDTTLRSFHYKFLMRIIPTNKLLYKFKLVNCSLCTFCNSTIESIEHLYWECNKIQPLCKILDILIASTTINITISKREALLDR